MGSTARTVPPGELRQAETIYVIPNALDVLGDSVRGPIRGSDAEVRWGLTPDTDIGLRIPSYSGAVITAKHRLRGGGNPEGAAVAVMGGMGVVNGGLHAHFELSLLASGPVRRVLTPYGGLRVMQVAPISRGAVHDSPTAGGFIGILIGNAENGISPELGVFYDRSALGLRGSRVIYVPAVAVHGDALRRLLPRW